MKPSSNRLIHLISVLVLPLLACGGPAASSVSPAAPAPGGPPVTEAPAAAAPASPAPPASEPVYEALATSPLTRSTPLQIVSVFAYEPPEQLISPATELLAMIAPQRTKEGFGKTPLAPLLLAPPPAPAKADRLLFIAIGPRSEMSLDRMRAVGRTAMAETLRLGVDRMSFAPIVRDQGVTTIEADAVAEAFIDAAAREYLRAKQAEPSRSLALREVTYEAGPQFVDKVKVAVEKAVAAAHGSTH